VSFSKLCISIVAQADPLRGMQERFGGPQSRFELDDLVTGLLLLGACSLGIFLLSRFANQDRRRSFNRPRALFRELCKAHGLDFASRRLLARLARSQKLKHPARLFLEPARFEPPNLSPELAAKAAELRALRDRLFREEVRRTDRAGTADTKQAKSNAQGAASPRVGATRGQ